MVDWHIRNELHINDNNLRSKLVHLLSNESIRTQCVRLRSAKIGPQHVLNMLRNNMSVMNSTIAQNYLIQNTKIVSRVPDSENQYQNIGEQKGQIEEDKQN